MSKHTDSRVASVGHAGQSAGALVHGGRRMLLVAAGAVGVVLLAASVAFACTTYWGQITIENLDDSNGEFSVVADPTSGMDRCDGAMDDGSGGTSGGTASASGGDTVRVEISKWEPAGQDSNETDNPDCEASGFGDNDRNGADEHSLADAEDDSAAEDVYINTYDGDAYEDKDGDGVYEDSDDAQGPFENASNEEYGEVSSERIGDCMGDGSDSDVTNEAGPIGVIDDGTTESGEFDTSDEDDDGINDVDVTINPPSSSSGHAGAICVSEGDASDSAPQIPIEIL